MNLKRLREIEKQDPSTYLDFQNHEMEVMKETFDQVEFKHIHTIGGYTCLDLLYAIGTKEIPINNYEKAEDQEYMVEKQKLYCKWFDKENIISNNFIKVRNLEQVNYTGQDVLVSASANVNLYKGLDQKDIPKILIFNHYGHFNQIKNVITINKHIPLKGMTNRIAVFSNAELQFKNHNAYRYSREDLLDIKDVLFFGRA